MIFAVEPGAEKRATGGSVLNRLAAEANVEYLCAEDIVVHGESRTLFGNSHTLA
jgi:hypothetical protein